MFALEHKSISTLPGARSSETKIAADIDVSANRLITLPRLNTILYSTHAALVQNKAKQIDPIINFIIFMRYPRFVYLMSTETIWFRIILNSRCRTFEPSHERSKTAGLMIFGWDARLGCCLRRDHRNSLAGLITLNCRRSEGRIAKVRSPERKARALPEGETAAAA
jgi:hypothetical protein